MNKFYLIGIIIAAIIASIFIIAFGLFGYILYNKYIYLFKVIRKMENDKYLWPLTKKISNGITNYLDKKGKTLLIGVGNCTILDSLVKKLEPNAKIDVIDSNKYLLEIAKEKYGERCNYIEGDFLSHKFQLLYENVVSSLPHKEFVLQDIDLIFDKYYNLSTKNIIYFEIKNSYVKMLIDKKSELKWELTTIKNFKNIPPVNLCILKKKI
jgi:phospholipid N-methyltransferase